MLNSQLTSSKNPLLQQIRRAAYSGEPTPDGLIVAEGPHLLREALGSVWKVERVFTTPEGHNRHADLLRNISVEVTDVSSRAFASTSATETSQEVFALLRPPAWSWHDVLSETALLLVLDGIQDPGNAGTAIRSAEAFGATGVILLKPSVRLANGKFLRATAGSVFRLPCLENVPPTEFSAQIRATSLKSYALAANGNTGLLEADLRGPCALIAGNESAGVSPELLANAQTLSIPTQTVESLNAAVACSIALFEAYRQRNMP